MFSREYKFQNSNRLSPLLLWHYLG